MGNFVFSKNVAIKDNSKIKHLTPEFKNIQNNLKNQQIVLSETRDESQNPKKVMALAELILMSKKLKKLLGYLTASTKIKVAFREGKMSQTEPACQVL